MFQFVYSTVEFSFPRETQNHSQCWNLSQKGRMNPVCHKISFQIANLVLAKCSYIIGGLWLHSMFSRQWEGSRENHVGQYHTTHLLYIDSHSVISRPSLQIHSSERPGASPSSPFPCAIHQYSQGSSLSSPPSPSVFRSLFPWVSFSLFLKQNYTCNTFTKVKNRAMCFVISLAVLHTTRQSFLLFRLDDIITIHKLWLEWLCDTLL